MREQETLDYSTTYMTQRCSCFSIQMCTLGDYGVQWSQFTKLCKESVSEHCQCFTLYVFTAVICLYSNLYTYNASDCKCTIIRLHCATSKSSLWYMGYVPCGGATELPHIYRTNVYMYIAYIHVMHVHVYIYIYMMYMYTYTYTE